MITCNICDSVAHLHIFFCWRRLQQQPKCPEIIFNLWQHIFIRFLAIVLLLIDINPLFDDPHYEFHFCFVELLKVHVATNNKWLSWPINVNYEKQWQLNVLWNDHKCCINSLWKTDNYLHCWNVKTNCLVFSVC